MRVASEFVNCHTGLKGDEVRADTNGAARPLGGRGGALRIGGRSLLLTRLMCEDTSTEGRIGNVLLDGETGTLDVETMIGNVLTSIIPGLESLLSHDKRNEESEDTRGTMGGKSVEIGLNLVSWVTSSEESLLRRILDEHNDRIGDL